MQLQKNINYDNNTLSPLFFSPSPFFSLSPSLFLCRVLVSVLVWLFAWDFCSWFSTPVILSVTLYVLYFFFFSSFSIPLFLLSSSCHVVPFLSCCCVNVLFVSVGFLVCVCVCVCVCVFTLTIEPWSPITGSHTAREEQTQTVRSMCVCVFMWAGIYVCLWDRKSVV